MKELTVPIDQAGRIVLPKDVRDELAIKPGDKLMVSIHGISITLTPNKEISGLVRRGKALVFSTVGDESLSRETVDGMLAETRDERDSRSLAGFQGSRRKE
jgi:AbrB family looped-hinge helix DNA binding protein